MNNDAIGKVEWAVSFSQKDMEGLREGDWLNLKEELYDFIYGGDILDYLSGGRRAKNIPRVFSLERKSEFIKRLTRVDAEKIKNALLDYLQKLIPDGDPVDLNIHPVNTGRAYFLFGSFGQSGRFSSVFGSEDNCIDVKVALGNHFITSGIGRWQIRSCPECNRHFLIKRKPRMDRIFYCSMKCASTASSRAHRKRKPGHLKVVQRKRGTNRLETGSRGKRTA